MVSAAALCKIIDSLQAGLIHMHVTAPGIVLHVEDDRQVRASVMLLLGAEGYETSGAASGVEALRLVAQGLRPDILIVDFSLEGESNGAEVAEDLRRVLGYALPIIMLTGDPTNAQLPWITDAPVWLARKPMSRGLLVAALPSLVQLSRTCRALGRSAAPAPFQPT